MKSVTVADGWTMRKHEDGTITVEQGSDVPYVFFTPDDGVAYRFLRDLFNEHYEDTDEG